MSIWSSQGHIGTDTGLRTHQDSHRGNVLSYADGVSNHFPDLTGTYERPAMISTALIPVWCVPGREAEEVDDLCGPWLRLSVEAPESMNFWGIGSPNDAPIVEHREATVVLDQEAVRSLRDDLTAWLAQVAPLLRPATESETTT